MTSEVERGLQRERTALAWDRTGLSFMLVGVLLVRVVGPPYGHLRHVPAGLTIALGGALVATAARGRPRHRTPRARPLLLRLVGAASIALSGACLAAVVLA